MRGQSRMEYNKSFKTVQKGSTEKLQLLKPKTKSPRKSKRSKSSKGTQLWSMHKFPLSFLCDGEIIWEKCSVLEPFNNKEAINLRPMAWELMSDLQNNLNDYSAILHKVEEWRSKELYDNIIIRTNIFFDTVNVAVEKLKDEKIEEITKIFKLSNLHKLDDLKIFKSLLEKSTDSWNKLNIDFNNLNFPMIYLNKSSNTDLINHLEAVTEELTETK